MARILRNIRVIPEPVLIGFEKKTEVEKVEPDLKEIEEKIKRAQQEAEEILKRARQDAESIKQKALREAEDEKRSILEKARNEAEEIKARAYREGFEQGREEGFNSGHAQGVEKGREEGYETGYRRGYDEGFEKGKAEFREAIQELKAIARSVIDQRQKILQEAEPELVDLSLSIARKVIQDEIDSGRVIKNLVKAVIKYSLENDRLVIKVNPKDMKHLDKFKDDLFAEVAESRIIDIVQDESVEPGGCVVITSTGQIDAQIGGQLKKIVEALKTGRETEDVEGVDRS